jgi:hypothetical protein
VSQQRAAFSSLLPPVTPTFRTWGWEKAASQKRVTDAGITAARRACRATLGATEARVLNSRRLAAAAPGKLDRDRQSTTVGSGIGSVAKMREPRPPPRRRKLDGTHGPHARNRVHTSHARKTDATRLMASISSSLPRFGDCHLFFFSSSSSCSDFGGPAVPFPLPGEGRAGRVD